MKKYYVIAAACLFSLAGCSDSDSTDTPETDTPDPGINLLTGVFLDSAVSGLAYQTETRSGVTNEQGQFQYLAGENVTFSIGSLQLPVVPAAETITPVTLSPTNTIEDDTTVNIARLLQSLDADDNPDNGIVISDEAASASAPLDFSVSQDEFGQNAEVINLVANSGSVRTELLSSELAISHLSETLAGIPAPGSEPDAGSNPDEGTDPDAGSDPDEGTDPDAGSDPDEGTDPDAGSDPDEGTDPDAGSDPDEGTDPDAGSDPDEGTDPDAGSDPDEGTDPDVAPLPPGQLIETLEEFTAAVVDKTIFIRNSDGALDAGTQLVINAQMKVTGFTPSGNIDYDWFWENGTYCRSGVADLPDNPRTVELECQTVVVDGDVVTFIDSPSSGGQSSSWFIR
ncbi:MAG: hypothetical protein AB8B87_17770 [Granulosicoccus sp.]